jgi:hypothetical protein
VTQGTIFKLHCFPVIIMFMTSCVVHIISLQDSSAPKKRKSGNTSAEGGSLEGFNYGVSSGCFVGEIE